MVGKGENVKNTISKLSLSASKLRDELESIEDYDRDELRTLNKSISEFFGIASLLYDSPLSEGDARALRQAVNEVGTTIVRKKSTLSKKRAGKPKAMRAETAKKAAPSAQKETAAKPESKEEAATTKEINSTLAELDKIYLNQMENGNKAWKKQWDEAFEKKAGEWDAKVDKREDLDISVSEGLKEKNHEFSKLVNAETKAFNEQARREGEKEQPDVSRILEVQESLEKQFEKSKSDYEKLLNKVLSGQTLSADEAERAIREMGNAVSNLRQHLYGLNEGFESYMEAFPAAAEA